MVKLFCAGPVNEKNPIFPEIGHREPEFEELYKSIKNKLYKVFKADEKDFEIVIINGSGTAALETVISSIATYPLILSNGAFGDRLIEICQTYRIDYGNYMPHWGNPFDLKVIEQKLKSWDNYEEVIMVYLETSTGMLNQIREIGELCKKYKKTFIVDAMSALACEELDMEKDNIDFCISSSNKGIGGPAVLSFVCCRKDKLGMYYDRSFYLNLNKYLEYGKINQTPTTPQIPLFYILNERLDALIEEGIDNIIKRYQENGFILQDELKLLKLNFYLKIYRSNVMVNVMIPDGYTFKEIHNKLKEKGFLIYNGKGILKDKVMNIATIGEITTKDIEEFIKALKEILNVE